jgi:plasmid stabilization system protein ParE
MVAIANYIAANNETAAREWVHRLRVQARRATRFPNSGRVVPEFERGDIREFILRNYRIVYLVGKTDLFVLTVFEGHRQIRIGRDDLDKTLA